MTRILQILEATQGGTAKHLDHIITGLHNDFDMSYIYSVERNPAYRKYVEKYSDLGVACFEVPMQRNISLLQDRHCIKRIKTIAEEVAPDIVHAHSSKAGYCSKKAVSGTDVHLMYTPHCLYFPALNGFKRAVYKWGERYFDRRTDTYIAVSEKEKKDLVDHITVPEKVVRIDNGVELPDIELRGTIPPVVLTVGRAVQQKGWDLFVETASRVCEKNREVSFVFAGEGEEFGELKQEVKKQGLQHRVECPGYVENMDELYNNAGIVAVTSRWEGQPYSVLEAMAFGCPVAGFNIGGMDELITQGENGVLAEPFNCEELAGKIVGLLADPENGAILGKTGRKIAGERFSRNKFLDNMRKLYSRVHRES